MSPGREDAFGLMSSAEVYFALDLTDFDQSSTPSLTLVKHQAPLIIGFTDSDVFVRQLYKHAILFVRPTKQNVFVCLVRRCKRTKQSV